MANNPIHVVRTNAPSSERAEALRAFHRSLDQADENLRRLLPRREPALQATPTPTPRASAFVIADESQAFASVRPGQPVAGSALPFPRFTLTPPWYTGAEAVDATGGAAGI